jgi:hypothetical protein
MMKLLIITIGIGISISIDSSADILKHINPIRKTLIRSMSKPLTGPIIKFLRFSTSDTMFKAVSPDVRVLRYV